MAVNLRDVGQAIKRVQHRHHRTLDGELAPLGTTLVQWDALRNIADNPDSSSHRLAVLTFQTDQSFGTLATRLVERELIERYAGSGREILHRLTPAGTKLLRAGNKVVDRVLERSFAALDGKDLDVLNEVLTRLLGTGATEMSGERVAVAKHPKLRKR